MNIQGGAEKNKKQTGKKDVIQLFAEKVRGHKYFVSRWGEIQVEYFRGKDFVSFMKNHSEMNEILELDKSLEPDEIANILLKKNLLVRCDRVVKTVEPDKKKLSTFPAHLEIYHCQEFSDNDAFFAWTFVKRRPLWRTLLSFFWPFLTLAVFFFPVYPDQVKLLILFSCASGFLRMRNILLMRAIVFGALWILLGIRIWIFPNILAGDATLMEWFQFWPKKYGGKQPKWQARLFCGIVAVVVILLIRHLASDEAATASVGPCLDQPAGVLKPT